jgi:ribosomal protein L11 methylase PrmA
MIALGLILILISACLLFISWTTIFGAPWTPTSARSVKRVLDLADVRPSDTVYDLGSGDGRLVIEAAKRQATAVGIEIDLLRVLWSRLAIKLAGLDRKASIRWENFFHEDLREATVVTLYLSEQTNKRLRPKLERELRPGARVVSCYPIEGWAACETSGCNVYLYAVDSES